MTKLKIPLIPIHDSFVIQESKEEELISAMQLSFKRVFRDESLCPRLQEVTSEGKKKTL